MQNPNPNSMYLRPVEVEEVLKLIIGLQIKKAGGDDNIKPQLLKACRNTLKEPIIHIINLSFTKGIVPDKLKIAKVIPIYKKDDKSIPNNYRPISLLSILNKVMEKLMYQRVIEFLNKFKIIYEYQFGFRKDHSTVQAVIEIVDNILEELDKNNIIAGIYLDLSKAFDTVDHKILLYKLKHYGIRGLPLDWFKSYLTNRTQYTFINGTKSNLQPVQYGVPQGSVLGPLLFLIYVNDVASATGPNKLRLFADDSNVFCIDKNASTLKNKMISVITSLSEWFSANKLTINMTKTAYTIFTKADTVPEQLNSINVLQTKINRTASAKYLGLLLDEKLIWQEHIDDLIAKITKIIQAFKIVRNYVGPDNKKALYYAYVNSRIQYGIELFSMTNNPALKKLQIKQNRALKALYNKEYRTPTIELHKETKTLLIRDLAKLNIAKFVYKQRNNETPTAFKNYYTENRTIHPHNTRHACDLHTHTKKGTYGRKTIKYRGAICWNNIQPKIRKSKTVKVFARQVKKDFIENY